MKNQLFITVSALFVIGFLCLFSYSNNNQDVSNVFLKKQAQKVQNLDLQLIQFIHKTIPTQLQSLARDGHFDMKEEKLQLFVKDLANDQHRFWLVFRIVFQFFDVISNGQVSFKEIKKRVQQLTDGLSFQDNLLQQLEQQRQVFDLLDSDHDGYIDIETEGRQIAELARQQVLAELNDQNQDQKDSDPQEHQQNSNESNSNSNTTNNDSHHNENQDREHNDTASHEQHGAINSSAESSSATENHLKVSNNYGDLNFLQEINQFKQFIHVQHLKDENDANQEDLEDIVETVVTNFVGIIYTDQNVFNNLVKFVFDWFDQDQNGQLDACEVMQYIRHVHKSIDVKCSKYKFQQVRENVFTILDQFDTNEDGIVEWETEVQPTLPKLRKLFRQKLENRSHDKEQDNQGQNNYPTYDGHQYPHQQYIRKIDQFE